MSGVTLKLEHETANNVPDICLHESIMSDCVMQDATKLKKVTNPNSKQTRFDLLLLLQ